MKTLISIIVMLVAVGCGKSEVETKTETETGKTELKPLSPEEQKLVGSYVAKIKGNTFKFVLLENGKVETYKNGEKRLDGTWKISGKEVHILEPKTVTRMGYTTVMKIKPNGDLDLIARILYDQGDAIRTEIPKGFTLTWKISK